MPLYKILSLLSIIILIASCKPDKAPIIGTPTDGAEDYVVETIIPTGDEMYLNGDSDYIFDQDRLHTFELNIPAANLATINDDPTAEQYVEAALTFEGETISPIGVRYKGSIGAWLDCTSGTSWFNPSGRKTCTKLSMKIKINWDGSDAKFYGLKKLQLHSMNNDPTQLRERLGYHLYGSMGVPSPRAVHARLLINGEFAGLFALVEQIDGRFTRYHFDDGKGNLYKELWPLRSNGLPQTNFSYLSALKTNEDENPSVDLIATMAQEVADASETELQSVIEKWMDIDQTIAYAAVDRTIRNDDGAFHWYCNGFECEPHNFYWYEAPNEEKLHLIPWDLDHAFINIISAQNEVTNIPDGWGETRNDCEPFGSGFLSLVKQRSAACDKLTAGWASYEDLYEQKRTAFKEGPFAATNVDALLDAWQAQITEATQAADDQFFDAITMSEWQAAIDELKLQIQYARDN